MVASTLSPRATLPRFAFAALILANIILPLGPPLVLGLSLLLVRLPGRA